MVFWAPNFDPDLFFPNNETCSQAEVGMAVQKGTVQRAKASGIGSLSNSQGPTADGF
jgi:hypothetical protein